MAWTEQDPNAEIPYILRFDRRSEKPLTVGLKYMPALTHDEYMRAMAKEKADKSTEIELLEIQKKHDKNMFIKHVAWVKNYLDKEGKQIEDVSRFYDNIDVNTRNEIIAALSTYSILTESQRKN